MKKTSSHPLAIAFAVVFLLLILFAAQEMKRAPSPREEQSSVSRNDLDLQHLQNEIENLEGDIKPQ